MSFFNVPCRVQALGLAGLLLIQGFVAAQTPGFAEPLRLTPAQPEMIANMAIYTDKIADHIQKTTQHGHDLAFDVVVTKDGVPLLVDYWRGRANGDSADSYSTYTAFTYDELTRGFWGDKHLTRLADILPIAAAAGANVHINMIYADDSNAITAILDATTASYGQTPEKLTLESDDTHTMITLAKMQANGLAPACHRGLRFWSARPTAMADIRKSGVDTAIITFSRLQSTTELQHMVDDLQAKNITVIGLTESLSQNHRAFKIGSEAVITDKLPKPAQRF